MVETGRTAVMNYSVDEWKELQGAIQRFCQCKERQHKKIRGLCDACRLKKDEKALSYLIYWRRHRDQLLEAEGLEFPSGNLA